MAAWEVWDMLNADGADGDFSLVAEQSAESAALWYAEHDSDGHTDGLYHGAPQPIAVRNPTTGAVRVFEVRAEMVPEYRATEREEPS